MKYFLDTEFIENGKTIDLISIGLVAEDDRSLYLQNAECNFHLASDWVWRNVFPHLTHFKMNGTVACSGRPKADSMANAKEVFCFDDQCPWRNRFEIRDAVLKFITPESDKIEIWGYYADYDWVAFCQLFGTMMELPKGFPMYCRDVKQLCDWKGNPRLPDSGAHNALNDARHVKKCYEQLIYLPFKSP